MVLGLAGFGATVVRDPATGLAVPMGAGQFNWRVERTTADVDGTIDCDVSFVSPRATILQRVDEFIDFTSSKVTDGILQIIKGQRLNSTLTSVEYMKTACLTVPVAGGVVDSTAVTELTGLTAPATNTTITGTFLVEEGDEIPANILLTGTADAANDVVIGANQVTLNAANVGQTLFLHFTVTGNIEAAIGGPAPLAPIDSVEVYGRVRRLGLNGTWNFWARTAVLEGNTGLDTAADSNTFVYKLSTPVGWNSQSFIYRPA